MKAAQASDWQREPLPEQHTELTLDRQFSGAMMRHIRLGLVPEVMEDKWFIYWEKDQLFCHQSATGDLIFVVSFKPDGSGMRMVKALANRDEEQYTGTTDEDDVVEINRLIDQFLLDRRELRPDDEEERGGFQARPKV